MIGDKDTVMKISWVLLFVLLQAGDAASQGYKPTLGFVPDSITAIRVAEAVLIPIYGEQRVASERPFKAVLKDDAWEITGTFYCPAAKDDNEVHCFGGTAVVRISRTDCRILYVSHGK